MANRVLVTGASGFVGSHLVQLLAARGEVIGWSRSAPPAAVAALAEWQRIDLGDRLAVRHAIAALRPSVVYHCAGSPHVADSWQYAAESLSGNVMTTHHLLEALGHTGVPCRLLIPGSAHVYAPSDAPITEDGRLAPASPYALSKLAQEQLGLRAIAEDGVAVLVTRSFNHTGPRQTPAFVAPSMARQVALIERGLLPPTIMVGNLEARRDLADVRDVVRAYAAVMDRGEPGRLYNVASGAAPTMRAVLEGLIARARIGVRIVQDPERMRPNDVPTLVGDPSRVRADTGWMLAISFEQMLDDLLNYWRGEAEAVDPAVAVAQG